MDSVNSTTFIKKPPSMTFKQECILYTKEILSGRLFLGHYKERRYVSELQEYRDLVVISSEETELHFDLRKVLQKWLNAQKIKWVGITSPGVLGLPKAYCFWVKLSNIPFGHYWFQIKHVKLVDEEIILQLKCIRKSLPSSTDVTKSSSEEDTNIENETPTLIPSIQRIDTTTIDNDYIPDFDPKTILTTAWRTCEETFRTIKPYITWKNLCTFIRVTCALVIAIFMGGLSSIQSLGHFSLRLIREISLLVNAVTPIIIQIIDFLTKVVGGFYILLAGIFIKNGRRPAPPFPNTYNVPFTSVGGSPAKNAVDWKERNRILRQELLSDKRVR